MLLLLLARWRKVLEALDSGYVVVLFLSEFVHLFASFGEHDLGECARIARESFVKGAE